MGKFSAAQNSCGGRAERSHFLDTFGIRRHKHPPQVGARRRAFLSGGLGQGEMGAGRFEFRSLCAVTPSDRLEGAGPDASNTRINSDVRSHQNRR
jgi:hypothetical protein